MNIEKEVQTNSRITDYALWALLIVSITCAGAIFIQLLR